MLLAHRHGARLDAADTQWHLTSPTPYDPPLTYGGWRQSQALGARIASILESRGDTAAAHTSAALKSDSEFSSEGERESHRRPRRQRSKRRKHRVVIHSSPFLRCIQTSIAISAGIAQNQGPSETVNHPTHLKHHPLHSEQRDSSHLAAIPEPGTPRALDQRRPQSRENLRPILRVDAFLGEWLSPDYFDKITPPPQSKLMVAGAKADLLRRAETIDTVHGSDRKDHAKGNFPGGWGSSEQMNATPPDSDEDEFLSDLSALDQALPELARAKSHDLSSSAVSVSARLAKRVNNSSTLSGNQYEPPVPTYAISPSQPIPQGYVEHARDACIKVDYQWDSMRPPHEWGNGGAFGEEWSSMHKRFRRGLQEMLTWYRSHSPLDLLEGMDSESPKPEANGYFDDDDTDTVLVLITHGSGCNALIGALTNQPVLLDVGMASLTLAERKTINYRRVASPTSPSPPISPSDRRRSAIDLGPTDEYEVKLIASTDHLRAGSRYMDGARMQRTATMPIRNNSPYRYEKPRSARTSHADHGNDHDDDVVHRPSSARTTAIKDGDFSSQPSSPTTMAKRSNGGGLWSKPTTEPPAPDSEPRIKSSIVHIKDKASSKGSQMDGVCDTNLRPVPKTSNGFSVPEKHLDDAYSRNQKDKDSGNRSLAPSGLWGAPPQAIATERDKGTKRRWTLAQTA